MRLCPVRDLDGFDAWEQALVRLVVGALIGELPVDSLTLCLNLQLGIPAPLAIRPGFDSKCCEGVKPWRIHPPGPPHHLLISLILLGCQAPLLRGFIVKLVLRQSALVSELLSTGGSYSWCRRLRRGFNAHCSE